MADAQVVLDLALLLLLGVTLFHAVRLERALGVLKRDRAVLEGLVAGFNDSTRQAEIGVERLRTATEGAGRAIARQIEHAQRLRDDLSFLSERGEKLAERLEASVRAARMFTDTSAIGAATAGPATIAPRPPPEPAQPDGGPRLRSEAERDLLRALRAVR